MRVGRYTVATSNEHFVLFPESGLTKGDLIAYYNRIAPIMLVHTRKRPISMQRFPYGIAHEGFFHKDAPAYFPPWITRFPSCRKDGTRINYVVCDHAATLVYLANQACITIHTWPSKVDDINTPDRIIFDLDPSDGDFGLLQKTALALRDFLAELALNAFVMTTGSRGLHVVVPIRRHDSFELVHSFAHDVARVFVARNPAALTLEIRKIKRDTRIFIDIMRNTQGQTSVAPYAVRPRSHAPVATPLAWSELPDCNLRSDTYTIKNIFRRLEMLGDPWHSLGARACCLACARKRIHELTLFIDYHD